MVSVQIAEVVYLVVLEQCKSHLNRCNLLTKGDKPYTYGSS